MKVAIFLQARIASTRYPGKLLLELKGKTILEHIIERFISIKNYIDEIDVLVPYNEVDNIFLYLKKYDVNIFGGDPENVLKRFYDANKLFKPDIIVRATADNPLVDTYHLLKSVENHIKRKSDYTIYLNLPLGAGVEVINPKAIEMAYNNAKYKYQFEHVTPYIRENPDIFVITKLEPEEFYKHPELRLTIDEPPDYKLMKIIYDRLYKGSPIDLKDVITLLQKEPQLKEINKKVQQIVVP